jgi:hypothetical protein
MDSSEAAMSASRDAASCWTVGGREMRTMRPLTTDEGTTPCRGPEGAVVGVYGWRVESWLRPTIR